MQYKLIGSNDTSNIIKTVLNNRGINQWLEYLLLNSDSLDDYSKLKNINLAIECFMKHFEMGNDVGILCDTDTDGICSSTIMYQYIKMLNKDYPVHMIVHKKSKAHGLGYGDITIGDNIKLLLVPDAGSNDTKEHLELMQRGIDIICLDHHQVDAHTKDYVELNGQCTIIVNNQISPEYDNTDACGSHVTYSFLQSLDDHLWEENCGENFSDMVALANVADVINLKSFNTRAMVNYGIDHIKNKMLKEIIKAQEFSMQGIVSPFTMAFYIGPLINAFLRSATYEERILLSRAFCEDESETFEYTKRGEAFPTEETIYEHVVRLMKSYKGKQDRARDKAFNTFMAQADKYSNDKVAIIDATNVLDKSYTGLAAIKLSESLNKPVLLVRKTPEGFSGSGRAFDYCPIEDFRALVENCPESTYAQGHSSAFGTNIKNIDKATEWFNEQLKDISFDKVYTVDFSVDAEDMQISWCQELEQNKHVFAHGVDEPLWLIKNLRISGENAKIVGKNEDVIQIYDDDIGMKYVMFKCDESNEVFEWLKYSWGDDSICINIIGTCGVNNYKNTLTPQCNMKDCSIVQN